MTRRRPAAALPTQQGPWLRRVVPRRDRFTDGFPFDVPVVRALEALEFTTPVTFFVGENGSGKSTLLEGLAAAAMLPTAGALPVDGDPTLAAQRKLGDALALTWRQRVRRGVFLRAEDFFGWTQATERLRREMQDRVADVERDFAEATAYVRTLASGPARSSLRDLEVAYGADPDARSHGQAFLRFFAARLVPDGLFLLDEPEAPLSPQNQLGFLAMLHDAVRQGGQFIIATHAPILLAYPGATIFSFDTAPPAAVPFDALDHVRITRDVLTDPARWLARVLADPEP